MRLERAMFEIAALKEKADVHYPMRVSITFGSLMTLFCDASFCPESGAGGWGAWFIRAGWEAGKFTGGQFRQRQTIASDCELAAIANAMHVLSVDGHLDGIGFLLVQSDCLQALSIVAGCVSGCGISNHENGAILHRSHDWADLNPVERRCITHIRTIRKRHDISMAVRHVRGHKRGKGRQWVNRQCDRIAREHMEKMRRGNSC